MEGRRLSAQETLNTKRFARIASEAPKESREHRNTDSDSSYEMLVTVISGFSLWFCSLVIMSVVTERNRKPSVSQSNCEGQNNTPFD